MVFTIYTSRAEKGKIKTGVFYFLHDHCLHFGGIFQGFWVSHKESDGDMGAGFCLAPIWIFLSLSLEEMMGWGGENTRLV